LAWWAGGRHSSAHRRLGRGNPLFIEELLRAAHANPERVDCTLTLGPFEGASLPPAVEALIAAELDCLPPQDRMVLELASVVGRVFDWASVASLAPAGLRPQVGAILLALARRGLICVADQQPDQDAFIFRHGLLRVGAYQAIPLQRRAALHMQVAERIAEMADRSAFEDDQAVGHLEQAYHYLAQLAGGKLPASTSMDWPLERLTAEVTARS
jgi:predicted ATPase